VFDERIGCRLNVIDDWSERAEEVIGWLTAARAGLEYVVHLATPLLEHGIEHLKVLRRLLPQLVILFFSQDYLHV
jgi:hypothetical protein